MIEVHVRLSLELHLQYTCVHTHILLGKFDFSSTITFTHNNRHFSTTLIKVFMSVCILEPTELHCNFIHVYKFCSKVKEKPSGGAVEAMGEVSRDGGLDGVLRLWREKVFALLVRSQLQQMQHSREMQDAQGRVS